DVDSDTPSNKPLDPDKGIRTLDVEIHQSEADGSIGPQIGPTVTNASGCKANNDNLTLNVAAGKNTSSAAFTTNQANRFGPQVLTALVVIKRHDSLPGDKFFRLVFGSGQVYGDDKASFALADDRDGDGAPGGTYTTYSFGFVPDCTYKGGSVNLGLNALSVNNQEIQAQKIKLYIQSPSSTVKVPVDLKDGVYPLGNLVQGQQYRLWLVNVGTNNGITVNLPYGEYAFPQRGCNTQCTINCQGGTTAAQCTTATVSDDLGWPKNSGAVTNKYPTRTLVTITHTDIVSGNQAYKAIIISGSPTQGPPPPLYTNKSLGYDESLIPAYEKAPTYINHNYFQSNTWNFTATDTNVVVSVQRQYTKTSGSTWVTYPNDAPNPSVTVVQSATCYHLSGACSISVTGTGPGGIVVGGGPVFVTATLTNDGPQDLPAAIHGNGFFLNYGDHTGNKNPTGSNPPGGDYGNIHYQLPTIPAGQSATFTFQVNNAPDNITSQALWLHPVYINDNPPYNELFNFGSECWAPVNVYQQSVLEPKAQLTYPSDENPTTIAYNTGIINHGPAAVSVPTTSSFTYTTANPVGCLQFGGVNSNGPYNPSGAGNTPTYVLNSSCTPTSITAGDHYCAQITLTDDYNQVYVGPPGTTPVSGGIDDRYGLTSQDCLTVKNKPYFKVYNSGVSAGGTFSANDGSCKGGGLVAGWNDNTGGDRGAGAQLSALALIKITGFASAQTIAGRSPTNLTFANSVPGDITTGNESPDLGGNFDPTGDHCLTDALPSTKAGADTATVTGPYTLGATTIGVGQNKSIFVNGDVRITGNITYGTGYTLDTVPSFVLHATGKIYIDPGVTELDGLYIARSKIYTCDNGFAPMPAANIYANCNSQLTVYGSFVANQINLMRAYGSLRNAVAGEQTNSGARPCSSSGPASSQPICAAEVFRFSPDMYLSDPAIQLPSNGAVQYDAITSLAPVL
ncbi:MAG: hypothetical protein WA843_01435, partial [Candidatus Saccharimonadales bacterium]